MKSTVRNLLSMVLVLVSVGLYAQPPGGRQGGGPEEHIAREKQALYEKVTDLSDNQRALIDGIYDEFLVTLKETMQSLRESGDHEGRREKMMALKTEKDGLMADVLNEEQYQIYQSISTPRRQRRGGNDSSQQ